MCWLAKARQQLNVMAKKGLFLMCIYVGCPIPLFTTGSRKNIWPFHASRRYQNVFTFTQKSRRFLFRMWHREGVELQKFDFGVSCHVCHIMIAELQRAKRASEASITSCGQDR